MQEKTYLFGTTDHSTFETVTFQYDLVTLETCVDGQQEGGTARTDDFEGFEFTLSDSSTILLSPGCPFEASGHSEDLTNQRLIGFRTIVSDY